MSINVCNDRSMASITSLPSGVSGSSLVLISTQTASSSATIDFTSGIDSTYKEYIFKFTDIHPATDNVQFSFQANVSGGSGFNETITSTFFRVQHMEDNTPDLDMEQEFECVHCGHRGEVEIPITVGFFWPES